MNTAPPDIGKLSREFVGLPSVNQAQAGHGTHPCQGLYWTPKGERPKTAFIATHYNVDYTEHYLAPYLAERGYGFLGWNNRYRGAEDVFNLDNALLDIGVGVDWLKHQAQVDTVIILGNSGGASLMGAYLAEAIDPSSESVRSAGGKTSRPLIAADAYVSVNSHPGRPDVLTTWLDPSVIDETDPTKRDASIDMFNPENGPPYSPDFQAQYRQAQINRNNRITDWVKTELKRLHEAQIPERIFPLFGVWADLRFMDPAIDPSDRLCPSCYRGDPAVANRLPYNLGRANTLNTWLSMWSLSESKARVHHQLPRINVPALVVQGTHDTGCFPSDAQTIFDALGSEQKELKMVPGAHYFEGAAEQRHHVADLIADWTSG